MHKFRQKYIGDKAFYKRYLMLAIPMIIQNAITNLVSFLDNIIDRKSTRLNSSHNVISRMPSSA